MFLHLQDHVQEIVVDMVRAIQMVSVNAKVAVRALTAPLVFLLHFAQNLHCLACVLLIHLCFSLYINC